MTPAQKFRRVRASKPKRSRAWYVQDHGGCPVLFLDKPQLPWDIVVPGHFIPLRPKKRKAK